MRRPANDAKVLQRIRNWREQVPDLAIRSTFVVGFPGETEEDFAYLLAWLEEAQLDRVGAFKFEPVEGAPATSMDDQVPEDVKQERYEAVMALSRAHLAPRSSPPRSARRIDVLIDAVDAETGGATGRSKADAPEIDGEVHLRDAGGLKPGDIVAVADRGFRRARPLRRAGLSRAGSNDRAGRIFVTGALSSALLTLKGAHEGRSTIEDEQEHQPERDRDSGDHQEVGPRARECRGIGDDQHGADQADDPQDHRHSGFAVDQPVAPEADEIVQIAEDLGEDRACRGRRPDGSGRPR